MQLSKIVLSFSSEAEVLCRFHDPEPHVLRGASIAASEARSLFDKPSHVWLLRIHVINARSSPRQVSRLFHHHVESPGLSCLQDSGGELAVGGMPHSPSIRAGGLFQTQLLPQQRGAAVGSSASS